MTKCIVIGEQPTQENKKPIEFVKAIISDPIQIGEPLVSPYQYNNIELIAENCYEGLDVMFVYDENRSDGTIYLGHWNDGVAE